MNLADIGILFDLDGVLIDSEEQYSRLWRSIDRIHPSGIPDFERVIKGTTLYNILSTYYPDPQVREDVHRMCLQGESDIVYGYAPGARQLLDDLRETGVKVAMVTSSDGDKMQHLWHNLPGLKAYFHTIIDGEAVTRSKPDPEGYLLAAARLGLDPSHCIVVEDSLTGMMAGRRAGCRVLGLSCTLGEESVAGKADIIRRDLSEVSISMLTLMFENPDVSQS